ncbi:MAG: hypothetical protein II157_02400, partial [Bacteroidales bacterium]|nr:hypothetical protein [Bacteroidales bacterium]
IMLHLANENPAFHQFNILFDDGMLSTDPNYANDLSEGVALKALFGDKMPYVGSTKCFSGHTTSAAGALEAVISILCIQNRFIPANLRFETKDPGLDFCPVTENLTDVQLRHVMSNSFGFGGNDSSLIFSSPSAI